jgi:iron complex transport system ATP-binding protein
MASSETGVTIETRALGFSYGGRPALEAIDLRAEPGEVVGLVGPNGSGKSTLIRALSGVLEGYSGSARIAGREVREIPRVELARLLAVVPQEPSFSFPFTALEVALMGRHPHLAGLTFEGERDVALAREALDRCGVGHLASRAIQELSSGERQRVVFAKALAQEPGVFLLDEPASFLDIRHQVELYDIVREMGQSGCTVLSVMHDLNLAAEYCDRVYLLQEGSVAASGPTEEVLTREHLTRVFGTEIHVDTNELTGKPRVTPLSGQARR